MVATFGLGFGLKSMGFGLSMSNHEGPISISENEFAFIFEKVRQHRLMNGYDLATAWGCSALAAAIPMQEYGGRLVSMDCYAEELYNDGFSYAGNEDSSIKAQIDPDGEKLARKLKEHFKLKDLKLYKGISPQQTSWALASIGGWHPFTGKPMIALDYAFIDGLHTLEAMLKDTLSIIDFINRDHFVIFYHDTHFDTFPPGTWNIISSLLGCRMERFETESRLGWFTNIRNF